MAMDKLDDLQTIKRGLAAALASIPSVRSKTDLARAVMDAMVVVDRMLGLPAGEFYGVAFGRGSMMFASANPSTKWTKFEGLAQKFATRELAAQKVRALVSTWATKHMWQVMTFNEEELQAYYVLRAVSPNEEVGK